MGEGGNVTRTEGGKGMNVREIVLDILLEITERGRYPSSPVSYTHLRPTRPLYISYAVFCLKKKNKKNTQPHMS